MHSRAYRHAHMLWYTRACSCTGTAFRPWRFWSLAGRPGGLAGGEGAHLACAPSGNGSAEARPPFRSAAGRQTRCRLSNPEAQAPRAHSPPGSCPRAGADRSAAEVGHMGSRLKVPPGPPVPIAPAKSMGEVVGGERWRAGPVSIPSEPKDPAQCPI